MDISVIVLTFNQESTIGRTLESILSQKTDAEYEIIIGDDCSSDATQAVCEYYQKKYPAKIKYFRRDRNLGLVANYYDCFEKAQGKYIADCSADDIWLDKNKLQSQFQYLETHPDVTLVSGLWENFDFSSNIASKPCNMAPAGEYNQDKLILFFLNTILIHLSASLYRKKVVSDFITQHPKLFYGEECVFEDLQIVMACALKGKVVVLPDTVFRYSIGHESFSHSNDSLKKFKYSSSTLKQLKSLESFFLPEMSPRDKKSLEKFYKKKGDFLSVHAFKAGRPYFNPVPMKDIEMLEKGWKGKFYYLMMKNEKIWDTSLKIWKIIFPNKF